MFFCRIMSTFFSAESLYASYIVSEVCDMRINDKIFLIFLFFAGVGICAGSFFAVGLGDEAKSGIVSVLNAFFRSKTDVSASESGSFPQMFLPLLAAVFAAYLSAYLLFPLPLIPVYISLQGVFIGFSAVMTLETFGIKGILYILVLLMPQNLIQLPVFCALGMLSFHVGKEFLSIYASRISRGHHSSSARSAMKVLRYDVKLYTLAYLFGAVLIAVSCAMQALLLPSVF